MLKSVVFLWVATVLAAGCRSTPTSASQTVRRSEIKQVMCRVGKWMLAHRQETPGGQRRDTDWTVGAWYAGEYALYDLTRDPFFLAPLLAMEKTTGWRVGPSPLFADDQCIAQTYLDLYLNVSPDPSLIAHVRGVCDAMIAYPSDQPMTNHMSVCFKGEWSWCDSLFMGPAVWSKLSLATGDNKYLAFMDKKWQKTRDFLYDADEHLYFRDASYFTKKEANGKKVFWSRGNGWVLAGLARVLETLPSDFPSRPRYERQFKEMAGKIVACQQPDGLWHASLLDPASFPLPETSGSGFYCYALAWGINNGLLDRAAYEPAVWKAWSALAGCVTEDGKLTHVQPIGADPKAFNPDSTEVYGVGAFLLAGREVYRLRGKQP
ncbi:MAG: glycoside hydrolase family 88 protein [bacterium]